jgi:hypothetical protein
MACDKQRTWNNSYFVEIVGKLTDQNSGTQATYNMTNLKINTCP